MNAKTGWGFGSDHCLVRRQLLHTGERPYKCKDQGKTFDYRSSLALCGRSRTGEKPHQCKDSGKASALLVIPPNKEKPTLSCEEQGRAFSRGSSLVRRERARTGEKLSECEDREEALGGDCQLSA